jgi:diguanylate cyclase (GGDEF)-like protein
VPGLQLDAATLAAVLIIVCTVVTGLLALTWLQNRNVPAFGAWTASFALCGMAAAFVFVQDRLPGFLALDIANALRLVAFGIAWQGARHFNGRRGSWIIVLAPAALWLGASGIWDFGGELRTRILLSAPVVAIYAFAIARELWRASPRSPWIARAAAVLLMVHGVAFSVRFFSVLLAASFSPEFTTSFAGPFHPIAILEGIVLAVTLAFLLMSVGRDQIALKHRDAALIDPLTGVPNRRAFEAEAERVLLRAIRNQSSTALLLLDLDHFKRVNDSWGHPVGDHALQVVAKILSQEMRGGDVLGRLGGEEFAILLADSRTEQAAVLAERVRRIVSALPIRKGNVSVDLTVSIGVAALRGASSLATLIEWADAALYRAKAAGRNRVELAPTVMMAKAAQAAAVEPLESRAA